MKRDQLEAFYQQYADELYYYALSLCKNTHQAEELVSSSFYKSLLSWTGSDDYFKYWLFQVCKHEWLDGCRKKKYISDQSLDELSLSSDNDVLQQLLQKEERQTLYRTLLTLPDSYREILVLYYFCEIPLKEIAVLMHLSPGAARMLISRARNHLKQHLNKEDFL